MKENGCFNLRLTSLLKHTLSPKVLGDLRNNICLGWILKGLNVLEWSETLPALPFSTPLFIWFMSMRLLSLSFEKKMASWYHGPLTLQMNHWPAVQPLGLLSLLHSPSECAPPISLSLYHDRAVSSEGWVKPAPGTCLYFILCSWSSPSSHLFVDFFWDGASLLVSHKASPLIWAAFHLQGRLSTAHDDSTGAFKGDGDGV